VREKKQSGEKKRGKDKAKGERKEEGRNRERKFCGQDVGIHHRTMKTRFKRRNQGKPETVKSKLKKKQGTQERGGFGKRKFFLGWT